MNHITGLLLALAICKGVTASGGNNTINTKDSYTVNKWLSFYTPFFPTIFTDSRLKCVDIPNFKDKYGTTCARTKEFGNCNGGKPWKQTLAQLQSDANAEGVSVLDACCVCGGGTDQSSMCLYILFFFHF